MGGREWMVWGLGEEGGGGEGTKRWTQIGGVWPIDRRPRPPRDSCGYKSSVRGVYGEDGGLGQDKRTVISTNLDEF